MVLSLDQVLAWFGWCCCEGFYNGLSYVVGVILVGCGRMGVVFYGCCGWGIWDDEGLENGQTKIQLKKGNFF